MPFHNTGRAPILCQLRYASAYLATIAALGHTRGMPIFHMRLSGAVRHLGCTHMLTMKGHIMAFPFINVRINNYDSLPAAPPGCLERLAQSSFQRATAALHAPKSCPSHRPATDTQPPFNF